MPLEGQTGIGGLSTQSVPIMADNILAYSSDKVHLATQPLGDLSYRYGINGSLQVDELLYMPNLHDTLYGVMPPEYGKLFQDHILKGGTLVSFLNLGGLAPYVVITSDEDLESILISSGFTIEEENDDSVVKIVNSGRKYRGSSFQWQSLGLRYSMPYSGARLLGTTAPLLDEDEGKEYDKILSLLQLFPSIGTRDLHAVVVALRPDSFRSVFALNDNPLFRANTFGFLELKNESDSRKLLGELQETTGKSLLEYIQLKDSLLGEGRIKKFERNVIARRIKNGDYIIDKDKKALLWQLFRATQVAHSEGYSNFDPTQQLQGESDDQFARRIQQTTYVAEYNAAYNRQSQLYNEISSGKYDTKARLNRIADIGGEVLDRFREYLISGHIDYVKRYIILGQIIFAFSGSKIQPPDWVNEMFLTSQESIKNSDHQSREGIKSVFKDLWRRVSPVMRTSAIGKSMENTIEEDTQKDEEK